MNELFSSSNPQPKKVGVWAESTHIEAKNIIIPRKTTASSSDDIPTLPDFDDFQDILEKDLSKPPVAEHKDTETADTLADIGGDLTSTVDGIDGVLKVLRSCVPQVDMNMADTVWTVDGLLAQLADEEQKTGS
ncbi:hypothetical protein JYU34_008420 [Plutella xylostella]|uniref:Uncharacterized protein n=2 Tax=Plutella xylostella TaxID=51655 RepID=A0ABQ7QL09_PLUXY|nr:uncharacterized protein LOC105390031 [Plutella xylostella]KAG7305877.1 hypothetical protein JYU34_008420 [Plutella xylostella]CAG9129238.1 unnamed protein product [Plutella xylostella]